MPRTYAVERTVYTWNELSDSAKDTARQEWSRFLWSDGSMQESLSDLWENTLTEAGWVNLSDLSYDLYSQGGYPAWSGTLEAFEHGDRAYPVIVRNSRSGFGEYTSVDVDSEQDEDETDDAYAARIEAVEGAARDHLHSLSYELLYAFRAEDEYQCSDDVMAETAEANGYEYTEDGRLA